MIDSKAVPLDAGHFPSASVPVDRRTALVFNALAAGSVVLAALLPLGLVAYWSLSGIEDISRAMAFGPAVMPRFDGPMRLGAALVSLLALAPLAWGFFQLRNCFAQFALGRPFSAKGIAGLRDFSTGMTLSVIAKPISYTVLTLMLSWNAPAGQRQLAVRIDSDALIMALFAAIVASLAWAMQKAAAIAEENSQFI